MSDAGTLLVTGATGALGEAVAARLLRTGHRLVLTGRNEARLADLAGLAATCGGEVDTVVVDATSAEGAERAVRHTLSRFGGVDGMVHLVGGFAVGPVAHTPVRAYLDLFHANVVSAVTATQAVLPHLGDGGRLVYVSSLLASEPFAGLGAYAASKAALQAWVRSLAHEVKGRGVHANTVVMTMADTPDARASRPHVDFDHATRPEDVAKVIEFLVGPGSEGLYGCAIPVLGRFEFGTPLLGGGPPKRP
jgi:NAD(P)-dependent dehydrogenase (short-subunit alcohol dehydrogenase family)